MRRIHPGDIEIREATSRDIPSMLPLWQELMDMHKKLHPLFDRRVGAEDAWMCYAQNNIDDPNALVLVSAVKGRVVAHAIAVILPYPPVYQITHFGHIVEMVVHPAHRRQGVGGALTERIKAWFKEKKVRAAEVRLLTANPLSSSFWRKVGFVPYMETLSLAWPEEE